MGAPQISQASAALVAAPQVTEYLGCNSGLALRPLCLLFSELLPVGCGGAGSRVVRV
jgi:hypothetical protein